MLNAIYLIVLSGVISFALVHEMFLAMKYLMHWIRYEHTDVNQCGIGNEHIIHVSLA